jgi:hypothetical protein
MHAATDRDHRPLAQDGAPYSGTVFRADARLAEQAISTSRTHREQSLQTNCKPSRVPSQLQNTMRDNRLNGAPEEIRTPDPQIRSLISTFFCCAPAYVATLLPPEQATDKSMDFVL